MSRYLEVVRGQHRRGEAFTAKAMLHLLAAVLLGASALFWWTIQSKLTGNVWMASVYTLILVATPPILTSFLIPWSPGGMLLQRINARTTGYIVVVAIALFLCYYSWQIQYEWWSAQPNTARTNLVLMQTVVGIIGYILVPALAVAPVSGDELVEQIKQAHLVRRYEIQTQADIAILRATLTRATEKALIGFANLSPAEREELAQVMHGLVQSIDRTAREIGHGVREVSGAQIPIIGLDEDTELRGYLDEAKALLIAEPTAERARR